MSRKITLPIGGLVTLLACTGILYAQKAEAAGDAEKAEGAGGDTKKEAAIVLWELTPDQSIFNFDYGPPTSPALNLLGPSADKGATSTSLKKFVLSVPGVFGDKENQSAAVDLALSQFLIDPSKETFRRYLAPNNSAYRIFQRTRLSAAVKNGAKNDAPAKATLSGVVFGVTTSLLDASDPYMASLPGKSSSYLEDCGNAYDAALSKASPPILADIAPGRSNADKAQTELWKAERKLKRLPDNASEAELQPIIDKIHPWLGLKEESSAAPKPQPTDSTSLALANIQKLTNSPELKTKLGDVLADALTGALSDLATAIQKQGKPTRASDNTVEKPEAKPTPRDKGGLLALIAQRVEYWKKRQDELDGEENKRIQAAILASEEFAQAAKDNKEVKLAKLFALCADRASTLAQFGADLDVGVGQLWRGKPGELAGLKSRGQVIWAGFRLPFMTVFPDLTIPKNATADWAPTDSIALVGSGRYGFGEQVKTTDNTKPTVKADTISAWGGLEYQKDGFRATAQYGWVDTNPVHGADDAFGKSGSRYLLNSQIRLGGEESGIWLGLSYGNGHGDAAELKSKTAQVTISFSPPKAPFLSPPNAK